MCESTIEDVRGEGCMEWEGSREGYCIFLVLYSICFIHLYWYVCIIIGDEISIHMV